MWLKSPELVLTQNPSGIEADQWLSQLAKRFLQVWRLTNELETPAETGVEPSNNSNNPVSVCWPC